MKTWNNYAPIIPPMPKPVERYRWTFSRWSMRYLQVRTLTALVGW